MKYHDQPLQFLNKNFFQINNIDDENYQVVLNIITYTTFSPLLLLLLTSGISIAYLYPKISERIKSFKQKSWVMCDCCNPKWQIHVLPIFLTNVIVFITLLVFHFISVIRQIEYGDRVLYSTNKGILFPSAFLTSLAIFYCLI